MAYCIFSNKCRGTHGVYLKVGRAKNCFDYDIAICCIKLTELTSFNFHYNGAVAPRAMALGGSYSRAALIRINTVMLSTWFASILLIVHDKKTQAMILGNPFQEPVLNIGDSVIFIFF